MDPNFWSEDRLEIFFKELVKVRKMKYPYEMIQAWRVHCWREVLRSLQRIDSHLFPNDMEISVLESKQEELRYQLTEDFLLGPEPPAGMEMLLHRVFTSQGILQPPPSHGVSRRLMERSRSTTRRTNVATNRITNLRGGRGSASSSCSVAGDAS